MKHRSTSSRTWVRPNWIIFTFVMVLSLAAYQGGRITLREYIFVLITYVALGQLWRRLIRPVLIYALYHDVIDAQCIRDELSEFLRLNPEAYAPTEHDLEVVGSNYYLVAERLEAMLSQSFGGPEPDLDDYLQPLTLPGLTQDERDLLLRLHLPTVLQLTITEIDTRHRIDRGRVLLGIMRQWHAV